MLDREFKKKLIVQLTVGAVILGVVGAFVVLFEMNISNQADALVRLKEQRALLYNSSQNIAQLVQGAKQAREYETAISALVPTKDQVLLTQKNLQDLGTSQGVAVNISFDQESVADDLGMKSIPFTATAEGSFSNILNFLRALEKKYPYIGLTSIDVTTQNSRVTFLGKMLFVEP
jgi:hypothetical protein